MERLKKLLATINQFRWNTINCEPVIFLTAISVGFYRAYHPLFTLWARCVELATDPKQEHVVDVEFHDMDASEICLRLSNSNGSLLDIVEKDIAFTKIWIQTVGSVPSLITAPIIGSWSDRHGRKYPLLFVLASFFLFNMMHFMATATFESMNVYVWYFASEVLIGMTGGVMSLFIMTLAMVTDGCRAKLQPGTSSIPMRVGIASFLQSFGSILAMLVFSFLSVGKGYDAYRHQQSYIQSSLIGVIFSAAALAYAIFFVRETHFPNRAKNNKSRSIEDFREKNESSREEERSDGFFTSLLRKSSQYLASLAEVLKAKRPGYTRCCIILSLIFVFFEYLAFDSHLVLLYVKRPPFSWSDRLYSNFHLAESILTTIGMVLCPFLLSFVDWLGKDNLMIIFGLAASAVSFLVIAFAHTTVEIFATVLLYLLVGATSPAYRSFLPRMVRQDETARLLTVLSIIMGFCPPISAFIFNNLFNYSLSFWAGFPFLVAGILVVLVVIGQIAIHFLMRPQWKLDRLQKVQKAGSHITLEYRSKAKDSSGDL